MEKYYQIQKNYLLNMKLNMKDNKRYEKKMWKKAVLNVHYYKNGEE